MLHLGAARVRAHAPGAEVQLVMVQGDATVMNSKIAEFGDALTAEGTPVTSCVVDGLLNGYHSPTGPWNYPGEPMGWIPPINCDSVNFLAEGTPFPTDGEADIGEAQPFEYERLGGDM